MAEVRHDDVEGPVAEGKVLSVGFDEDCLRDALSCHRQHGRREVCAGDLAAACHKRLRDVALAAAEIERVLPGAGVHCVKQRVDGLVRRLREQLDTT